MASARSVETRLLVLPAPSSGTGRAVGRFRDRRQPGFGPV